MIAESLNSDHSSRDSSREISVNKKKIDKKSAKKPVATSSPKVGDSRVENLSPAMGRGINSRNRVWN
jgi:hypothetical protein